MAVMNPTNETTSDSAKRGPEPAFVALVNRESAGLVAASTAIVGSRHVAEELVQECFLRAANRWDTVGSLDRPGAWMRKVVVNESISQLRRRDAEARSMSKVTAQTRPDGHVVDLADELPDTELWSAVRNLPNDQAQAVALRYVGDLTTGDVAEALGISVGAVNSLLFRARQQLRRTLSAEAPHV